MLRVRFHKVVVLACAAGVTGGCINTDPAIFVEASLQQPTIAIEGSVLASAIAGGVVLDLHLGPRASGPATVSLVSGQLLSANGTGPLLDGLSMTSAPSMPLTVGLDEDVEVRFSLAASDNLIDEATVNALCEPGSMTFSIGIDDSLRGGGVSATSGVFSPSGCP